MPLSICLTDDERLVGSAVQDALRAGMQRGSVTLWVPSFSQALTAQKSLAQMGGMSLGVEVATPASWSQQRWDVWGDGRRAVEGAVRMLLMESVAPASMDSPGTIKLLCDLAQAYLPWLDGANDAHGVLTDAESEALQVVGRYARVLEDHGLIEGSDIMCRLALSLHRDGVPVGDVVVCGFDEMSRAERTLVTELARITQVSLVARALDTAAFEATRALVAELEDEAPTQGLRVDIRRERAKMAVDRAQELGELCASLFEPDAGSLRPAYAVRLLEPAGPLAEAELVAREVDALASRGMRSVGVATSDGRRAWRELVPKLAHRGYTVTARLSVPVLSCPAGISFMAFARTVARLSELEAAWPEPQSRDDGQLIRLGDMSWWAPAALTDFLLCDIAQVPAQKAWALDASWRANRLLTPTDVLSQLLSGAKTSEPVARATKELLRGRLGSAASGLLGAYAPGGTVEGAHELVREENVAALGAVISVAATLRDLGVSAAVPPNGRQNGADRLAPSALGTACSLSQLVVYAERVLQNTRISLRPRVQGARGVVVDILSRGELARREPASCDALIMCGLTSEKMPIPTGDDVCAGIAETLGLDTPPNPLRRERVRFARMVAVPRKALLLERPLFSAQGQPTYPAVLLGELASCYKERLLRTGCSETPAAAQVCASGCVPVSVGVEQMAQSGRLATGLNRLVTVPPEGQVELPGGLPTLSASQIESYLECPLKWFSLRRLRLSDCDAGFGPLEMGTFVHRVLELTYGELAEKGWHHATEDDGLARKVLEQNFEAHRAHQYMRQGTHMAYQALVAHSVAEEAQYDRLLRDLTTVFDYQDTRLLGFEPRYFEWEFGRKDDWVEYAGVRVTGTVDRIDVNAHGQALIIDYKHKGPAGFFGEYAVFGKDGHEPGTPFELPRRIQALMYAQVVRRAFPDLKVVGALYLGTRGTHELSGAVASNVADNVFGAGMSTRRLSQVEVAASEDFGMGAGDERGMDALLDACEMAIAQEVENLRKGLVGARPVDDKACQYCPVNNCERRMA